MKKIILLLLVTAIFITCLAGCGGYPSNEICNEMDNLINANKITDSTLFYTKKQQKNERDSGSSYYDVVLSKENDKKYTGTICTQYVKFNEERKLLVAELKPHDRYSFKDFRKYINISAREGGIIKKKEEVNVIKEKINYTGYAAGKDENSYGSCNLTYHLLSSTGVYTVLCYKNFDTGEQLLIVNRDTNKKVGVDTFKKSIKEREKNLKEIKKDIIAN